LEPDVTEEEIRESVRESFAKYAPGGGYVFAGQFTGPVDSEETKKKNEILHDEVYNQSRSFYK
jgi:hypothetical protein